MSNSSCTEPLVCCHASKYSEPKGSTPRCATPLRKWTVHFDLNYFKYCYLKLLPDLDFNELTLQKDFNSLCSDILSLISSSEPTVILRDFQARNIMLVDQQPYFIDYQGCRLGPAEYDLASFLWQSSAHYSPELREALIDTYIQSANQLRPTDGATVRQRLKLMVLFRLLQVLGAYGFRGLYERKAYFLNSIPPALNNLRQLLATGIATRYPYLEQLLNNISNPPVSKHTSTSTPGPSKVSPLTVTIHSFSYRKGIPDDPSGNGGGYVFDCRSTHNPGRYEPYKQLTGLDREVIDFLEYDGEIVDFLSHIYPLADHHVERYVKRGFTSLMFSFGCTGGQHRSVYCAQHLAEHLRKHFPQITIHLVHREQGIDKFL